ncbi:Ig-like domain-containing protein, partial [Flavobacterium sp. 7A]|uniref:DUF7507 domain-containing protein n=1 Tax=Flavobacterium sp. 7A TaxID=2940571 RepID=UPI0022278359
NINVDSDGDVVGFDVPGQGTWNVTSAGAATFTPLTTFTANPTPIVYTIKDNDGNVSNEASITITYVKVNPIAANDISKANPANSVVTVDPLVDNGSGLDTDQDGFVDGTRVSLVVPVGATSNKVDSKGDVTSITVPNQGTWVVDEISGAITFTPLPTFHKDPTPIDYTVRDNDGNISNVATVTIDYVPVATDDSKLNNVVGQPAVLNIVSNDTTGDTLDLSTIDLDPSTPVIDTTLVVANQGTWTVDASGVVTFTPLPGFTTDPAAINYTVKDAQGNVSNIAKITVGYTEIPPIAIKDGNSGNAPKSASAPIAILSNDKLSDGTPATVTNTTVDLDPNTPGDNASLIVAGQGVWNYNTATGELVFTPEVGFTANPTPIVYKLTEVGTGLSASATVTVEYVKIAPVANNDISKANPANSVVTVDPLVDNGSGLDTDQDGFVDGTRVSLVVPVGATSNKVDSKGDVTSITVPNQGTWVVDEISGAITFTPLPTFHKDPTPIDYTVRDNDGNISNVATVTIDYVPVATDDSKLNNVVGQPAVLNIVSNDTTGDTLDLSTIDLDPSTPNIDTTLVVANQGTWTVDASGVVTFTPLPGFTTDPAAINYTVKDAQGNVSNIAKITVGYTEIPPIAIKDGNSGNAPKSASAPIAILSNDKLSDGTPATVTNTTVDLNPNTPGDNASLIVAGQGVWNYNTATGELVFTPEAGFTANPTPLVYKLTEVGTGLSASATVTVTYVKIAPVAANDVSSNNTPNTAVSINPILNPLGLDTDGDGTINPATVSLVPPAGATAVVVDSNGDITSLVVPGQGLWSVDPVSGVITFTPLPGFHQDPTLIAYNVEDNDGNQSNNATVTIDYKPIASDDKNTIPAIIGQPVTVNVVTNDTNGDLVDATTVVLDPTSVTGGIAVSPEEVNVPGIGSWIADNAGNVTFTPDPAYTLDPPVISYTVKDDEGNASAPATITLDYTPISTPDVSTENPINTPVVIDVVANDTNGDLIDPITVSLVNPGNATNIVTDANGDITSLVIPGEGTWNVNLVTGVVTFTPNSGFITNPTPINYNVEDNQGNQSNSSPITISMIPQADLVVTKTDNKEKYTPGTNNVYTIVVKNNGPALATNVVVLDDITSPILEAVTTWSAVGTGSAVPPNATGTGDITAANATIATFAVGETVTYTVTIAVPSNFTGQIVNTASASSDVQDPVTTNNSQTDVDTITALSEIAVSKTVVSTAPYKIGENITFLVTATNNGPSDATGINIVDKLPSGYSLVSATPNKGTYTATNGLWNVGGLTNTSTATLTVVAKINAAGNYTNTAEVTKVDQADPNGIVHGNNTPSEIDQSDITIVPVEIVDLVTTKTVDKSNPNQGDIVKYTLTVVNKGPSTATGVNLTDNLPAGLVYVSHFATGGTVNTYSGGLWTIGNINIGSSAILVIDARVTAAGTVAQTPIVNTATAASGNESDPTTVGDDLTEPITVTSSDLVTEKTVSNSNPSETETITYTIKVTNNGPSPATAVRVTDILPIGVTYIGNNLGGDYNYGSGLWTVGDIAVGATKVLNIDVTPNPGTAGKTIVNTTTAAKGNQSDPTTLGDDLNESIVVQNSADIVLTKIVDNNTPNIGDIITYTVTVTNKGSIDVTNLVIKDKLPGGLTFFSATPGIGVWSEPNWTIGTLLPGEKGTIILKAIVGLDQGGRVLLNTVTNTQDQFDSNTTRDDPSESLTVTGLDLGVLKTVSNETPNVGETITYSIKVTNNGFSDATSVAITDRLPVGVTYVSSAADVGLYNNGSGLWSIGNLANGSIATLTIKATVNPGTFGSTITNTTSAVTSDQADSNVGNNIGTVSIVPTAFIDLHLTKEVVANVTNPAVGEVITFEVRVINDGPSKATGVQVVDLIPSGYKFVNYSSSIGTYTPSTGLWNVGFIEVGNTAVLLVDVKVLDSGNYLNCAEITKANEPDIDSTPGNGSGFAEDDYACASAAPNQSVDLAVVKTILKDKVNPKVNSAISFEILLTNNGNIDATNVVVTDLLPSGYIFVNYSSTKGIYDYKTGDWKVAKIVNGETEILIVDVIVNESGDYLNCAKIKSLHQVDTNPANNSSCIATVPVSIIDLELAKEVDILKPFAETNVEFTITLTNKGPSKGTGVQVKDLLPSGMTYVSATPSIGSYNAITGIWNVGTIGIQAVETLKVVAFVLPVGEFTNVAEVIAANELDVDSTPNNNKLLEDDQDAVVLVPEISLVISEGFSPNGDGLNDVFEIQHLQVLYPNFSMEIVNRYGNIVYQYKHNGDKFKTPIWWNGYSTGRWNVSNDMLPAGTYFYTIYFNNDDRKPQTGWIYLRR